MSKGLFLCIEGSDGTGKGTQHQLLIKKIESAAMPLLTVDFPRYGEASAKLVERYLNNEFGEASKLDPQLASLPYAIDRLAAKEQIEQARNAGKIVLANRFSASNMAHQGSKFHSKQDRVAFFKWLHDLEHGIMGIPEPDYHFILHVPAKIAQQRVLQKAERAYTKKKLDGHEADLDYLKNVEQTYLDLAETFPHKFGLINCMTGAYEKTIEEIHAEIWTRFQELLRHE